MLLIDNFLASIEGPGEWQGIDLDNHYIDEAVALRLYQTLVRHGNVLFDTYGMWEDLDGVRLLDCLIHHFTEKEDYIRCKWLKKRKEALIRLVGYFDRCRREKVERVRKKRAGR